MSPLRRLGRQILSYGLGIAATRFLGLLALPLFTAYMPVGEYGLVTFLVVLGVILRLFFGVGSSGAAGIVYFGHAEDKRRRSTIWSLAFLLMFGGLGVILLPQLIFLTIKTVLFHGDPLVTRWLLFFYSLGIAFQLLAEAFLLVLQFKGDARKHTIVSLLGAIVGVASSAIFVAFFEMGVMGWVFGHALGGVFLLGFALLASTGELGRISVTGSDVFTLGRVWLPLLPGGFAVTVMMNASPYFVGQFADIASAGRFGVGYQLGMGIGLACSAVSAAWVPYFQSYVSRQDEASSIFPVLTTCYLGGMGVLVLLLFVFAYPVVAWLTPSDYRDAWQVVGLVALGQMLMGLWGMLLPGMYYARETSWVAALQVLASLLAIAVYFAAIPRFGIVGGGGGVAVGILLLIFLQLAANHFRGYPVKVLSPPYFFALLVLLLLCCAGVWVAWYFSPGTLFTWSVSLAMLFSYSMVVFFVISPWVDKKNKFWRWGF